MKTNVKNYKTYSVFLVITGLLIGLILALTALASYAQSRFTYGLEAGLGSSQVDMSPYGGMVWSKNQWVEVSFYGAQNDRRRAWQLGGYARYYWLPALYMQSGVHYASDGGQEELIKSTYTGGTPDCSGGCEPQQNRQRVDYTFHYGEVPLLLGVRLWQQIRLYGGFSWGLVLGQNVDVLIHDPYKLSARDLSYTDARVGMGIDAQRFSMDIFYQETVSDNGGGWDATAEVPVHFDRAGVHNGASGISVSKVLATVSYRLH